MAKVVTSEGLKDFVDSGKPTEVIANVRQTRQAPAPVEMKAGDGAAPHIADAPGTSEEKQDAKSEAAPKEEETGLEAEDHDLADRAKKRIGKKHYEMKKAQEAAEKATEEAEAADRLAENLFNEREMWRKRAEAAETEREQLKVKAEPPKPATPAPDESDPKYRDEKGNFKLQAFLDDSVNFRMEEQRKQDAKAAADAAAEAGRKEFEKRIAAATGKYPDFADVLKSTPVQLQNEALQFIAVSEYGADIAYFLALPKNREYADKIRAMHPIRAIAELGKIETSFEKPANSAAEKPATPTATSKTVERPGAPAPITPISTSGTGSINVDPAKMSFQELRAYERERSRGRKR